MQNTNINTSVDIAGITFKNPIMPASGTFASGKEFAEYFDISQLGAVVTKGVSSVPWQGNDTPRVCEAPSGMMNAIGLQNPGVEAFIKNDLPFLEKCGTKVIVNVCGHSIGEYVEVVEALNDTFVDAYEINISCPNVKQGGIAFGTDPKLAGKVTKEISAKSKKPVIVKLSPNVTDITLVAKAVEDAGADVISLINTLMGMKIDIYAKRFVLANRTGGLSGPAVHPVALRMVYDVCKSVKIPVIGMGGVVDAESAIEMLMAGATGVMVGTANFANPLAMVEIIEGIQKYLIAQNVQDINDIIGIL